MPQLSLPPPKLFNFTVNSDNSTGGFWASQKGIQMRLDMLGAAITTGVYNNALQVQASLYGVLYFMMYGPQPKCDYCKKYYLKVYRQGRFMPHFPAHPRCPHIWDVWFPWEEEY